MKSSCTILLFVIFFLFLNIDASGYPGFNTGNQMQASSGTNLGPEGTAILLSRSAAAPCKRYQH